MALAMTYEALLPMESDRRIGWVGVCGIANDVVSSVMNWLAKSFHAGAILWRQWRSWFTPPVSTRPLPRKLELPWYLHPRAAAVDMPQRRSFGFLGGPEHPAFEVVEVMNGRKEAKSAAVAHDDAGRSLGSLDDVGVVKAPAAGFGRLARGPRAA
jgi:hypothetical protein